jgi:adenine-specific DNA-methyltransferase
LTNFKHNDKKNRITQDETMSDANQQSNDKLDMQSPDLVQHNFHKLAELFPNCVTESATGKAIDFDLLKQELNNAVVEGNKERYRLEWPGKREAIVAANLPITKTLRPVREDSVDFDNTENIYIEGDNLEVLKLLQESYLGKIKMIYIDPPYNTGNDFVYKDNFAKDIDDELFESGQKDELSQRLVINPEASGRYHSDWLSMMFPRLKLARNLLKDDGAIFISVDDNEQPNLRKLCDEIFGEDNFLETLIWKRRATPPNDRVIGKNHEYILIYAKNFNYVELNLQPRSEKLNSRFSNPDNDPRGPWVASDLSANGKGGRLTPSCIFPIKNPITGIEFDPPKNKCWLFNKSKIDELIFDGRIGFRQNTGSPFLKRFLSEVRDGATLPTLLDTHGFSQDSAKEIRELFDSDVFDFPKPTKLLETIIRSGTSQEDFFIDFFSGSASSAHSIFKINAEQSSKRKFILVQLAELTDKNSEASKSGFKNICEIGKERIRRAAKKIKDETSADIDYGFRVYRLDESNMQDVYYRPQDLDQNKMDLFGDNVKPDRTEDDLLAQIMLDWGLPLNLKIEQVNVAGKKLLKVDGNSLFACFDTGLDEAFAKEIAKEKPLRIVFKDAGFKDDTAKTNVKQLLKQLSPETEMKVL